MTLFYNFLKQPFILTSGEYMNLVKDSKPIFFKKRKNHKDLNYLLFKLKKVFFLVL